MSSDIYLNGITYPADRKVAFPGKDGKPVVFSLPEDADKDLNPYSERPVQNKVIHAAIEDVRQRQTSPYNFKGAVATLADLPSTGQKVNDTYYVEALKYRVTWTGDAWQQSSMEESKYTDELAALKSDLNYNSAEMDTTDYVKSLGIVSGRLKDDGTVDATQTGWVTTDYIPVESDKTYVYQTPNFEGDYSLTRCTFDGSKVLISYVNFTFTAPERIYPITGATKYVRFSVSVATYNAGIYFRAYHSRIDTLESYSDAIRDTYDLTEGIRGETDYIKLHRVLSGLLQSTGEVWASEEHMTTEYIPVSPGVLYVLKRSIASDFSVWLGTYDAGKNPVDYVSNKLAISGSYFFRPPDGVAYVRLCFSVNAYNSGLDFRVVNNWYDTLTENVRDIGREVYDFVEKGKLSTPTGWKLNLTSGLSEEDSRYQLIKYAVTAGEFLKVKTDDCFQFQSASPVPTTGTSYRIGIPYQAGEYYLVVPENATHLIVSTSIADSKASVCSVSGAAEKVESWITADEELLEITDYIKIFGWEVGKLVDGVVDTTKAEFVTIADYIPLKYGELLSFYNNGHRSVWIDLYSDDKTFLKEVSKVVTDVDIYYSHYETNAYYAKISVSRSALFNHRFSIRKNYNDLALAQNNGNQAKSVFCIMGYNTGGWYIGTGTNVPEELTEQAWETQESIIARYNPDVLMLCEYWKYFSPGIPSARLLRKYYRNVDEYNAYSTYWGLCNATNRKIESSVYGTMDGTGGNKYLLNYIYFNGKKVAIINTHLMSGTSAASAETRAAQCRALLSVVENEEYFIMYGDWNIEKGEAQYDTTLKLFKDAGYNFTIDGNYETWREYPTSRPWSIDDIITSPNIVLKSVIVDEQKRDNPLFTKYDHSPVIAYFEIF